MLKRILAIASFCNSLLYCLSSHSLHDRLYQRPSRHGIKNRCFCFFHALGSLIKYLNHAWRNRLLSLFSVERQC
ncbi:hypothetical protein K450DRAFT_222657 [Umbelopsis ramanniana AG]|uniref:Secreted protein n=1 Tax=Umbelopsis ramanniana AG TaxID=1314678 RepID=A0AAD5EGX7_UMBRA|nr:uncharacterized protein K450DRAFT_222657 [Umbelopsis ramanniana AG]KAI8583237.1 hypothetical protein K450DRAFT_222657 [Umbelopsis ramanniana AG]